MQKDNINKNFEKIINTNQIWLRRHLFHLVHLNPWPIFLALSVLSLMTSLFIYLYNIEFNLILSLFGDLPYLKSYFLNIDIDYHQFDFHKSIKSVVSQTLAGQVLKFPIKTAITEILENKENYKKIFDELYNSAKVLKLNLLVKKEDFSSTKPQINFYTASLKKIALLEQIRLEKANFNRIDFFKYMNTGPFGSQNQLIRDLFFEDMAMFLKKKESLQILEEEYQRCAGPDSELARLEENRLEFNYYMRDFLKKARKFYNS